MNDDIEEIQKEIKLLQLEQERLKLHSIKKRQNAVQYALKTTKSLFQRLKTFFHKAIIAIFFYACRWFILLILSTWLIATLLTSNAIGFPDNPIIRFIKIPFLIFDESAAYTLGRVSNSHLAEFVVFFIPLIAAFVPWRKKSN